MSENDVEKDVDSEDDDRKKISLAYHWKQAAHQSVCDGTFHEIKIRYNKIFIGHVDSELKHYFAKYFRHKVANLGLPLTRSEIDLPWKMKRGELPQAHYYDRRYPHAKYTDFKGYFEKLWFLWFRESTYLDPFRIAWDCDNVGIVLDYYTQLYNSIFYPRNHEKVDECKLGMLMCQNCVQRTRKKSLYYWLKDKITTPKSTGIYRPEGFKETFIDYFVMIDPKQQCVEDMVLKERISAIEDEYDSQLHKKMEILCYTTKKYEVYGSPTGWKPHPLYAPWIENYHVLNKERFMSWDGFNRLVFPCSIFIYNIAGSLGERAEARYVVNMLLIKLLCMDKEDRERLQTLYGVHTFVVLSSLYTWSKTPYHLYDEFNEGPLFEEYYNKRIPMDDYRDIYDTETYFLDLAVQGHSDNYYR
ncbi:uncharacterized protein [Halyomorpha halys]|uniref:uncharacterized protein n=1 Tax=Halyomorpha halys TaxID=286706 RepID=UPI0034D27029